MNQSELEEFALMKFKGRFEEIEMVAATASLEEKMRLLGEVFIIIAPIGEKMLASEKIILAARGLQLKASLENIINFYKSFLKVWGSGYGEKVL